MERINHINFFSACYKQIFCYKCLYFSRICSGTCVPHHLIARLERLLIILLYQKDYSESCVEPNWLGSQQRATGQKERSLNPMEPPQVSKMFSSDIFSCQGEINFNLYQMLSSQLFHYLQQNLLIPQVPVTSQRKHILDSFHDLTSPLFSVIEYSLLPLPPCIFRYFVFPFNQFQ